MIIFEDQLARIIEVLPPLTSGDLTQKINFGWGTKEVLTQYLTQKGKLSFPLIWLEEGADVNDLREPSVKRKARINIIYESQAPAEFNPYQHEYDFKLILQPIKVATTYKMGHFVAKPMLVKNDIPKITKKLQEHDTSTFGAYFNKKGLEVKLEQLLELEKKMLVEETRKDNFKKTKNESSIKNNLGE